MVSTAYLVVRRRQRWSRRGARIPDNSLFRLVPGSAGKRLLLHVSMDMSKANK